MSARDDDLRRGAAGSEPTSEPYVDGFTWKTVAGVFVIGLVMVPGSIYLSLVVGQTIGAAAEWVTIIIFAELARRTFAALRKQEVYVLFYVASGVMSAGAMGWAGGLIWNQYLVNSQPARTITLADGGTISSEIPDWVAPQPDSEALLQRRLIHRDWLKAIGIMIVVGLLGRLNSFGLGYALFRLTSDVERLPFPLAPIAAEGATALAETGDRRESWRWNMFSTGAVIGVAFGALYVGVPILTEVLLGESWQILPIPFADLTPATQGVLPAAPAAISFDLGSLFVGFVIPFPIVLASFLASLLSSLVVSPLLHRAGVLTSWQPGMGVIKTELANQVDFWLSLGIGVSIAVAVIGLYKVSQSAREAWRAGKGGRLTLLPPPAGRGDIPVKYALLAWFISAVGIIAVCHILIPRFPLFWIVLFALVVTPLNSYVSARMIGLAGSTVSFPYVKEGVVVMSGYRGVDIWFAPIPLADHGRMAQQFRETELTKTKLTSLIKAEVLILCIGLFCSFFFWSVFWRQGAIPSSQYPYAAAFWPRQALFQCLWATANQGEQAAFMRALHPEYIAVGGVLALALYAGNAALGWPVLFYYGFIGGLGGLPNTTILMFIGGLLGRYYFARKIGAERWRKYTPVLCAGFFCGMGLIGMVSVSVSLLRSVIQSPLY